MDQGVAAVAAAGVAGTVAVAGSFIGVWVGRRTVRDQAKVEHEQWLRGQRQEAYIAVLDAWDAAVRDLRQLEEGAAEHVQALREEVAQFGNSEEVWELEGRRIRTTVDELSAPVFHVLERVQILGPKSVDRAAINLEEALHFMGGALRARAGTERWPGPDMFEAVRVTSQARTEFMNVSRAVLRSAPRPGKP
ncbi:hypothetical protein [Streptomyces sp. NPDC056069]|uniref:hypothetical protein n=1 Tax=Streptomyces sp. NPDC056069 TaxID=3345702 RepID=UPI0035DD36FA